MGFCFFVCMKEAAPHEADAFSAWIVGTLSAILVVGSVIINTTTLKAVWMPATIAVCIAITMLGVALVTSLLHYYKTGHFFAE